MRKAKNIFANIDSVTIILYLILIFFGWINIFASQYNDDTQFTLDFTTRYGKQLYFIVISLISAFIILIIDWKFYYSLSYIFYGTIIISLNGEKFTANQLKLKRNLRKFYDIF